MIPARGGSKGIPRKNIYPLHGKPLIAYTIEAALASELLTDVVVTTDDEEIAAVSRVHGAEVPFMRPSHLATDAAQAIPTIQHAVAEMEALRGEEYGVVVMLQPTTPMRTAQDIDESLQKLFDTGADSVISVVDVGGHHPMRDYDDEAVENMPRQELPSVYLRAGSVYATRRDVLMVDGSFKGEVSRPYVIPPERAANIDIMPDMIVAEYYIGKLMEQSQA